MHSDRFLSIRSMAVQLNWVRRVTKNWTLAQQLDSPPL